MYGKLFESTFSGSMYGRGPIIFAVWGYAIAHANRDGSVEINPRLVAGILGDTVESVQGALQYLQSPDPESRTKDEDGRRLIREGEYLFRIVNYSRYNGIRNDDERREYNRIKQREYRARHAASNHLSLTSADNVPACTPLDVSVSVDADKSTRGASEDEIHRRMTGIRERYPVAGRADWIGAEKYAREIVLSGEGTWEQIEAGVDRYVEHCRVTSRIPMNPARFFHDADRPWSQQWPIPKQATNGTSDPRAIRAWERLIATEGAERDRTVQSALDAIGGWQAIRMRTAFDEPKLKRDFCHAYSEAAA